MDGSEAMSMSGPPGSQFFIQYRNGDLSGSSTGIHGPPAFRTMPNPSSSHPVQSIHAGGGSFGSAFQSESLLPTSPQRASTGGQGELVRKKRGRPRKYGPDGSLPLALYPVSPPLRLESGSADQVQKRRGRGRPPGTGTKQQLASLGEWIAGSAGMGFTPHIIIIAEGEDITAKIMSFSQQGPRAVCILSANGSVSSVTLQQPTNSGGTVTYEGRFEILCMSGSYMMGDDGGSRSRSGGLSISLAGADGRVIGGGVGGLLIAASPVQLIVGSFIYGGSKGKNKTKGTQEAGESESMMAGEPSTPSSMIPPVGPGGWANLGQIGMRNSDLDIDLKRE